ncbi:hypothetical protein GGX14DRAFT_429821 [Mycena pura]|uniref:Transmembrane protein n=1 Tax=Mycena pura TaxID=153505 RepID=A0AAD6VTK6_9AGAR|nr:hypothetical protein GGX14DRAFT_429821 [Mycena pura]
MSRGPTPAEQSWLLDYVGVNPILAVWTAFRYRHFVVLLTTLGLWSTALAGIVATSLVQIEDSVHTTSADFNLATTLNRSLLTEFDPSILAAKQYVSSYLGRQVLSLSRPYWTTEDNIVVEAFGSSSVSEAERLIAQTNGYSAGLECTPVTASYGGNISIPANPPVPFLPNAYAIFVDVDAGGCQVPDCYVGRVFNHTCPGSSNYTTAVVLAYTQNFTFISASAAECSPTYSQYLLDVSASPSSSGQLDSSIVSQSSDSLMIDELHGMLQWLNSSNSGPPKANTVTTSEELDPFFAWGLVQNTTTCDCDPWLFLIAHAQGLEISDLMVRATLINASAQSFTGVFSDVAQTLLMTTAPSSAAPLSGSIQEATRRLVTRPTSIRIVQATMGVLLAVVIAVYLLRPITSLPMDPTSIAAQAVLMSSNHDEISWVIKDTITQTSAETQILLKDSWFCISEQRELRISARRGTSSPDASARSVKAPVWRPAILHPVFKISLVLILVGSVIGLEMGLRRSQRNNGFADSLPSNQDLWTYAAPAYLFVLGVFLSSYAFSVSTLEPFFAMHRSPQPARTSVRYSPATKTDVELAVHSLRSRNVAGFFCAAIMLTIPFLKIVVSGLFVAANEPAEKIALMAATTTFNTTAPDLGVVSELPKQILALSQIQKYLLPLPPWTAPAGAVAEVDSTRLLQVAQSPSTTITIPLEVMRAELGDCSTVAAPVDTLQTQFGLFLPTSPGWFGRFYPELTSPSVSTFIYGRTQSTNASEVQDVTAIQCLSYTVSMSTENVTVAYGNSTTKILAVASAPQTTALYNITFPADPSPETVNTEAGLTPDPSTFESNSSLAFDTVFQIMTLKNTSTPLESFLEPGALTTAAQAIFATYGAIYTSLNQRISIPAASQDSIEVTVEYQQARVVQAEGPTRILQALLGCILAFGLATGLVVRQTNNVLTKPPYSIGATMGLLADSAFVELEELQKVGHESDLDVVLEPYLFQLGWGNNPKGGMRFGVDIVTDH